MVRRPQRPAGFSLLEIAVVLAVVGVLSVMAVPNMMNSIKRSYLAGTADEIAAFLGQAQMEAIASRRCVKVYIANGTLKADRLNSYDCDTLGSSPTPVLINAGLTQWVNFATMKKESNMVSITMPTVPSESTSGLTGEQDQIRFRPTGRLFSSDTDVTDDDGVIMVSITEDGSASVARTKRVLVEAQGLICTLPLGKLPSGTGNNLACP